MRKFNSGEEAPVSGEFAACSSSGEYLYSIYAYTGELLPELYVANAYFILTK